MVFYWSLETNKRALGQRPASGSAIIFVYLVIIFIFVFFWLGLRNGKIIPAIMRTGFHHMRMDSRGRNCRTQVSSGKQQLRRQSKENYEYLHQDDPGSVICIQTYS